MAAAAGALLTTQCDLAVVVAVLERIPAHPTSWLTLVFDYKFRASVFGLAELRSWGSTLEFGNKH